MKAITVRQPWAWAIAAGFKTVENRTWSITHRGLLAIHAGRQFDRRARSSALIRQVAREAYHRGEIDNPGGVLHGDELPVGVVVAVAELVDVHEANRCCRPWGDHGLYVRGGRGWRAAWHWVLADIRPLVEPVPATGRLGLWDIELRPVAMVVLRRLAEQTRRLAERGAVS